MANTKSRTYNSMRNTFFAAAAFVLKTLLQFVVRALFNRYLAVEYLGLNGLFKNVLNLLSLAELGIGHAIVFSMYKPIADNDTEKVKSLLQLYKRFYLIIASVITAVGLALIPALPYIIKDAPDIDINLSVVYVIYLAQTVVGYFFAYRRALVFAYQRNDVESKVAFAAQVALAAAQILIIVFWKNYYAYVTALVVCNLLDALVVFLLSYKLFPEIRGKAKPLDVEDRRLISRNTRAMFLHKIGSAIVYSTDSIIISAFISAKVLGIYSNYTLVTAAFASVITLTSTAVRGSIGNLIATADKEKVLRIFKALTLALLWFTGFLFIGMFCCFKDFIVLFTGSEEKVLEVFPTALICTSFYFTHTRGIVNTFKECAGLFRNDRFKPLIESALNLGLDIAFVYWIGLPGVILATIISTVTVPLWVEPYVLYKNYFKKSVWRYFARYVVYTLITAAVGGATFVACYFLPSGGVGLFVAKVAICTVLPNALFLLIYFRTPEFKLLWGAAKRLFKKKRTQPAEEA